MFMNSHDLNAIVSQIFNPLMIFLPGKHILMKFSVCVNAWLDARHANMHLINFQVFGLLWRFISKNIFLLRVPEHPIKNI